MFKIFDLNILNLFLDFRVQNLEFRWIVAKNYKLG